MTLALTLRCPGPDGSGNGCPEAVAPLTVEVPASHDGVRAGWADLAERALRGAFVRCAWDQAIRCRACAARGPGTIAGIALRKWEEALARVEAGEPPASWGGRDGLPTARQWHNAIHRIDWLATRLKALPGRRAPLRRAAALPEARWADVLARFRAGEDKAAICTGRDGWPTPRQWNGRMERDRAFREAVNAEWARRKATAEAQIDAILLRFEAGEPLRDLLDSALRNRWHERFRSDPAFRERVLAQHLKTRNSAWSRAQRGALIVATLRFIAAGGRPHQLPGAPQTLSTGHHHRLVAVDPDYGAGYEAALEASGGRWRQWFDRALDWEAALEDVRKGAALRDACAGPGRPSVEQWHHRRRIDAGFRALLDEVRAGLRADAAASRAVRKPRDQAARAARSIPAGKRFRAALSQNELYAAVNRAVPLALPGHVRDDVIAEMVLAVLEGELDLDAVNSRATDYLRRYDRAYERWTTVSLDAPIRGFDDLKLIDTVSTDDALWG